MSGVFHFGAFELRPDQRRLLSADGRAVALGQRAFDVLLVLVERAGKLVSKDELLTLVWPGVVVEENNLQVHVSALRKVLGAAAITTTAGRGYRFTLPLADAPSAPSRPARPYNLPQPLTSFIGHDDDLDQYAALLGETRLLTLTGIGGCGKTRLALKLAERVLPAYPDGVWYVDLVPLQDADRVALTIATVLGIREQEDRTIGESIVGCLAGKELLLIVDNCEHLMAPLAALVGELLPALPGLRVLAASREGLGVHGERAVTVRSLSFPPAGPRPDVAELAKIESVRLFVDRVRLAVPRFALVDENADAIAEICRRLDGIPLAIELAAARVKMLSVDEIRSRLDDRFRLLTGGSRSAMGRQQTLLAAIKWSYDHLSADEQALLRKLAVFVGGWTLEAAIEVAGDARDEYAMLDVLTRLVDQSLVATHHVAGDATRYAMLETVRQYANERLDERGEGRAARDRHLAYVVALAEHAMPKLVGPEQSAWIARLDPERENVLAALAWCDHSDDGAHQAMRIVFALFQFFRNRGLIALGYRVTVEALSRPGAQARDLDRCRAQWAAGECGYFLGRYTDAWVHAAQSLEIARELGDLDRVAHGTRLLGYVVFALGDREKAREYFDEAVLLSRQLGDVCQLSGALSGRAELHRAAGEPQKARALYEEALRINHQRGDRNGIAIGLVNLAMTAALLGDVDRARNLIAEGLSIAEEIGSKRTGVAHLDALSGVAAMMEDFEYAAQLHGAVSEIAKPMGYHREPADEAFVAPLLARTRKALGAAAFGAAVASGRALSYDEAIADASAWICDVAVAPDQIT